MEAQLKEEIVMFNELITTVRGRNQPNAWLLALFAEQLEVRQQWVAELSEQ